MKRAVCASVLTFLGGVFGFFLGIFVNDPGAGAVFGAIVIAAGCIAGAASGPRP